MSRYFCLKFSETFGPCFCGLVKWSVFLSAGFKMMLIIEQYRYS